VSADLLAQGREAFAQKQWTRAFAHLAEADREQRLGPEDLQRLAIAAYLIGRNADSTGIWTRAHQAHLTLGNLQQAARCAFWLGFALMNQGERARAAGWIKRAGRLLDDRQDCVEQGYLLLASALQRILGGEATAAYEMFNQAAEIGDRFADPDLIALARHSRGRVLIRMGEVRRGIRLLDEAMVAVEVDEVSPMVVGDVYCSVIEGCLEILDLRRAREWTAALTRWCDSQPDLVPYSGQCLVRRAEILQLHGAWSEASEAAQRACERLLEPPQPACGAAFYRCGELHRLRGDFTEAEEAFRKASRHGMKPQPGLALLRLAQGQTEAATAAIRLAVDEAQRPDKRSGLLFAYVDIMLAAGDIASAHSGAGELAKISETLDAPLLKAFAAHAGGAVRLAEGDGPAALPLLRQAWTIWREIDAPYEAARVRALIGQAYRQLGDRDAAEMEFDAARWVFEQLEAQPDLARLGNLVQPAGKRLGGLSPREFEVLRLVAAGKSNRTIGNELFISERTVERHVSNIFLKLDVSSRAAATAYAYKHKIV
jgi:DNA-binding CsgD family transcriptional regulator/tetratricopeptide (TPR) repeat protein